MRNKSPLPRKPILTTIATLLLVFFLAGCRHQDTPQNKVVHTVSTVDANGFKTYKHSMDGTPTTLDPVQAATVYSNTTILNIFDTLYSYKYLKRPYELKPNLAVAMPEVSDDGLTYTIRIKPGVYFHDSPAFPGGKGREVTADDFVYSIKRHFDPKSRSQGAWLWSGKIVGLDEWKKAGADYGQPVEGLQALDRYTIQITLKKPYPQLIYSLAMGFSAIVPREAVEHFGKEFAINPVGSGPFILKSFDTSRAILDKNPGFRQEPLDIYAEGYDEEIHGFTGIKALHGKSPPFVDRIIINYIQESAARWNSFTKGNEIQYTSVPKEQQNSVIASTKPLRLQPWIEENFHHLFGMEAGFVYSGFNMDDPTFGYTGDAAGDAKNKALRCAIRKAYNWDQRNRAFYFGLGTVFPGIITPTVPEFDPDMDKSSITLDIEGAKKLLADAGWTADTLPVLEYHSTGGITYRQFFEQFRGFLKKIGYPLEKVKFVPYPTFGEFNKALKNRQAPYFSLGWGLDYPDAENTLQLFYGPNESPGSNNFNYKNPAFDALFEKARVMQPGPERTAAYRRLNQMVVDDCVVISGLSRKRIYLWHKNVIMLPDREILGGFFMKYVDVK